MVFRINENLPKKGITFMERFRDNEKNTSLHGDFDNVLILPKHRIISQNH